MEVISEYKTTIVKHIQVLEDELKIAEQFYDILKRQNPVSNEDQKNED
jgi:hypothetical protein